MAVPAIRNLITNIDLRTYDDLLRKSEDGKRYELIFGEIFHSPSRSIRHQNALSEVFTQIREYTRRRKLGLVLFGPLEIKFSVYNAVLPDLVYIKRERIRIDGESWFENLPDLIAEVIDQDSCARDIGTKAALYAQYGIPEYWIVDPDAQTIAVNELRDGQYVHVPNRRGFARSTVIPGLKVRVTDIFAMPEWEIAGTTEAE